MTFDFVITENNELSEGRKAESMDNYEKLENIINNYNLSGVDVLNILTDWHGLQLISDDFIDNLQNVEGYDAE